MSVPSDLSIEASKSLAIGDLHHRSYVGPPELFDILGASQFGLAVSLGLRESNKLLDLGCGSLRAGRFFINFLLPDRYFGIEPNAWLWKTMIEREMGSDILAIKNPKFDDNDAFDYGVFGTKFDMIIANSVFSHTGADLFRKGIASARNSLTPRGQFLFTTMPGVRDFAKDFPRGLKSSGWHYPECATYTPQEVITLCRSLGLQAQSLPWHHPTQNWFRAVLTTENLLSDPQTTFRNGMTHLSPRLSR